jgi:hypothetical protein
MCEKLWDISFEEFLHKLDIFVGRVEDDEREWREKKYGKQWHNNIEKWKIRKNN